MLTPTQIKIIGYLLCHETPQNIRGIARKLEKSYTLVYNNIEDLRKKEIIYKQKVPPAQIIKLNEHIPIRILIEVENKRKENFIQKYKWMEIFLQDVLSYTRKIFFILIIFGGYAKGKPGKKSDLDLLAITPDKKSVKEIESALNKAYTKVKKHIVVVDQNDFREMLQKPNEFNIGNEAKKNHIILYGTESYCQLTRTED